MTFRLPFQILRAVTRPTSPTKLVNPSGLVSKFQKNYISSLVDANNNVIIQTRKVANPNTLFQKQNNSLPYYITRYSFHHRFKSTFKGLPKSTNLENRKKVRKQHKCHEKKCERKLVFRVTTREECGQCTDPIQVPDKCPKLNRLKPEYDYSKLLWKHEDCPVNLCDITPRMDDIKGLRVVKKCLPKLNNDCIQCQPPKPKTAPKLGRPLRDYDPSKLKWKHPDCTEFCDAAAPRMDDVRGYKVTPKTLPQIKSDDCLPCLPEKPSSAPKLNRPRKRNDSSKMEQVRNCDKDTCNIDPPRMDDVCGYKVVNKELPPLPEVDDCPQCINPFKTMPKLPRLKKRYDPSEMKWQHPDCREFCEIAAPRMDDVMGLKTTPKQLPTLLSSCDQCTRHLPTISPKLARLEKIYDDKEMQWKHNYCPPEGCDEHPPRIDEVLGLKVVKKRLPKLEPSHKCTYCTDFVPTSAPKLCRPLKDYDDSKMKWKHTGCPTGCEVHPPRSDVVAGYKVKPKILKKLQGGKDCRKCINPPTRAPILERPTKRYDPSKMKWKHPDCTEFCEDAKRMDDVVGLKVIPKELPALSAETCPPCTASKPKYAPKLRRLEKRYDPSKMKWKHPDCSEFCEDSARMDDIVGLKVTPKKLPTLPALQDCSRCLNHVPKYAPKLKRPRKRYNPIKIERPAEFCGDICDLDPPRMDDVLCWKPKKKILPSFNINSKRKYSTLSPVAVRDTYCIYSHNYTSELREKAHAYGRRYSNNSKKCKKPKKPKVEKFQCKVPKPKTCMKSVPKFKMPHCKKPAQTICKDYEDKYCTKTDAPYGSYGECTKGFYEDGPEECTNWNEVLLQPQKQVSGHFYHIKPPPPKFEHVDPSKERKCLETPPLCPPPLEKPKPWENPCPNFKMTFCKQRGRKHCNDFLKPPKCKKLEPPYKSFADCCPQFPEVPLNECDKVEKIYKDHEQMVNYSGKDMTFIAEKACLPDPEDKCKPDEDTCKPKKKDQCQRGEPKCRQKDKDKGNCKPVKFPTNRTKCSGKDDDKITTMVCPPDKDGKKYVCVCKNLPDPCETSRKSTTKLRKKSSKPKMKCGSSGVKTMICTAKDGSKKICLCKPIEASKSQVCEPPKKVSSKLSCPKISNSSCCSGFLDMNAKQDVCNTKGVIPPSTMPPVIESSCSGPTSMWGKLCAYFSARPNCPAPHEWRQRELERKAREAAAAAGFEICPPKCKYIKLSDQKCKDKLMAVKPEYKKRPCSKPKKTPICGKKCAAKKQKRKSSVCAIKQTKSVGKCGCKMPEKKQSTQSCQNVKYKKPKPKKFPFNPAECGKVIKKKSTQKKCNYPGTNFSQCYPHLLKSKDEKPDIKCPPPATVCKKKKVSKKKSEKSRKCKMKQDPLCKVIEPSKRKNKKPSKKLLAYFEKCKQDQKKYAGPKISKKSKKSPSKADCKPSKEVKCPPLSKKPTKCDTGKANTTKKSKCKIIGPICKKKYSTVAKSRYFNAFSRISRFYSHTVKNNAILTKNQTTLDVNSLNYSKKIPNKFIHPYLRLDDRYVGKIYQLKFRKIGVKNSLVNRKVDDEPYTICHMCKVVPKHQFVFKKPDTNVENIKIKNNSERRQNM